jgi:6,7-dimethyl-8-ribityllumazine synthase
MTTYAEIGNARFAIAVSRFNDTVTERLLDGAMSTFARHGFTETAVDVVHLPGAFELPLGCRWLAETGRYAAIVALGAVVRGETPHFDFVAGETARMLGAVAVSCAMPIGFGLLTVDTLAQAEARAGGDKGNKGFEATEAALRTADLLWQLREPDDSA